MKEPSCFPREKLGATAACVARLGKGMKGGLVDSDSWFTGPKACVRQRTEEDQDYNGILKTSHAGTPYHEALLACTDLSRGTWVTFTATHLAVDLMLIAYVYSYSNTPCVLLRTCGSDAPGRLYGVGHVDEHGNVTTTMIPKPEAITSYHDGNTRIDDRNSLR